MKVYENFDLTEFNSYKIKAVCKRALFFENEQEVVEYFSTSKKYILLGSGHNIILSKPYYEEDFVIFKGNYSSIHIDRHHITVEAGAMMSEVSKLALDASLSGIEVFYDIPSSLGGAVVMNAGASGEEIKDVLVKVRYLDLADLNVKEILKEDMSFEYRNSFFQRNTDKIVLKAWLSLNYADKMVIANKMEQVKSARWGKQPKALPNAGSVFKRPPGYFVGALIDELHLKGYSVGGAKVSEKHGGFIINYNNATGKDIHQLIEHIKNEVRKKFNIELEVEQRII
jgi:UDP-N-acetylmuramate dehydrogenase